MFSGRPSPGLFFIHSRGSTAVPTSLLLADAAENGIWKKKYTQGGRRVQQKVEVPSTSAWTAPFFGDQVFSASCWKDIQYTEEPSPTERHLNGTLLTRKTILPILFFQSMFAPLTTQCCPHCLLEKKGRQWRRSRLLPAPLYTVLYSMDDEFITWTRSRSRQKKDREKPE